MFGATPASLAMQRQQQMNADAQNYANMDLMQQGQYGMYKGAGMLGDLAAKSMGMVRPEEELAKGRQEIASMIQDGTPKSYKAAAQRANQMGDNSAAMALYQKAQELEKDASSIALQSAQTVKALREPLGVTKTVEVGVEGHPDMRQKVEQLDDGTWSPVGTPYKVGGASGRVAADAQQFLTAEAVQQGGSDFRRTGKLPPALTKADKSRILNSAADEAKQLGNTGEAESLRRLAINTETSAAKSALGAVEKRSAGIEVGAAKIVNDIKTMQDIEAKGSLDIPKIASSPLNWARTQTGSPSLRAYALATKQVATEYTRMMTGGMLSVAQLHAGAQEEAKNILNENMTIAETRAIIPVMLREIENARKASADTKQGLVDNIQKIGVQPKTQGGVRKYNPATGRIE